MQAKAANPLLVWFPAIMLSLLAHATLVMMIQLGTRPDPVPVVEEIRTRIDVSSLDVPSQRAEARQAEGEQAEAAEASGERLGVQAVPTSQARPVTASGQQVAALAPETPASRPLAATGAAVPAAAAAGARLAAASLATPSLISAAAPTTTVAAAAIPLTPALPDARPQADDLTPVTAESARLATVTAAGESVAPAAPSATLAVARPAQATLLLAAAGSAPAIAAQRPQPALIAAAATPSQAMAAGRAEGVQLASLQAPPEPAATVDTASPGVSSAAAIAVPQGTEVAATATGAIAGTVPPTSTAEAAVAATAWLAWTGDAASILDEQSLAAIQSFMASGDVAGSAAFAGSVRDGIGSALAQFPCSRLQAAFQPQSGGLEIRGHIPSEEFRPAIVGMLQTTVGDSIPVGDSVLILPAPQCGVLDAVERLGVPQSRDQIDDPLVVGEEAQARIVRYEDGAQMAMELEAADYDSYIYIDYYDGDGNVIHLQPNEFRPGSFHPAGEPFVIGDQASGLKLTAAPPFGQDIVVVLATTAPLYDGVRPLVERADDYLPWLHARVDAFRSDDPGFRGEWAYLFVMTGPVGAFAGR